MTQRTQPAAGAARAPGAAGAADRSARIAALEERIAALGREAQRLEDISRIKKLQRAYGYYVDRGYWREAADLFADGARFETGLDGVYVGRGRIHEFLMRQGGGNPGPGLPYGQLNHRMQLQPVIHLAADGQSADGRWRELALLGQFKKYAAWGDGIYENRYVKQDGIWKIESLHYYANFVAPYDGGWAVLGKSPADWKSDTARSFPPDRPPTVNYRPFPENYAPPFHYSPRGPWSMSAPHDDIAELESLLAGHERDAARLASAAQIENLQGAYGYYIDKGLWDLASGLFSADATYEYGQRGVYVGRDRIRDALASFGPQGLAQGQLNNYMMLQPIIDVASDGTARARWRSDMQLLADGKAYWGEGTYENEYVREGGVWKISKLHFYVTMLADYDKGWVAGNIPMDGPSATLPPDRPPTEVYGSLPEVYLPAYHYEHPVSAAVPPAAAADQPADSADTARAREHLRTAARQVDLLIDQAAVEKLQRCYGYYVDKAMWPDVAALFADSGTLEIGGRGVFVGKARVLEYLGVGLGPVGPQQGQIINHQQLQGIVTVAPDGMSAKGRWTAFVMGGSPYAAVQWGDVTYENDYVKEDGVWKISRLHAPFTMYSLYSEGWHKSTVPNTRPDSFPPPPDLPPTVIYLTFPSFYLEPFHYPNPVTGRTAPPPNPAAGGVAPMGRYSGALQ